MNDDLAPRIIAEAMRSEEFTCEEPTNRRDVDLTSPVSEFPLGNLNLKTGSWSAFTFDLCSAGQGCLTRSSESRAFVDELFEKEEKQFLVVATIAEITREFLQGEIKSK